MFRITHLLPGLTFLPYLSLCRSLRLPDGKLHLRFGEVRE